MYSIIYVFFLLGDAWGFGGEGPPGGNEQKPPPQPQAPGGNKIDIGAMLNMIRNSVVNASNAAGNKSVFI